jgi:hypothetical protein
MPGVHHFPNGVVKIKYLTAREHNTILRVCCLLFHNLALTHSIVIQYLPPLLVGLRGDSDPDMIVVPALRELACVLLLGHFQIHTSDTLGLLQQHIVKFGEYSQVRRECGKSSLITN